MSLNYLFRPSMLYLPAMAILLGTTGHSASASSCPANTASNQLAVQVVNDSGKDDDAVYLLLSGANIGWPATGAPAGLKYFDIAATPDGSATVGALSALTSCGTMISPYTGESLKVYSFPIAAITSGRMMVSYSSTLSISDGNFPTGKEQFRWDKMEFGYPNSGADLTSLDFFSVPMQFDYLDDNGHIIDTMTFYSSTKTILDALYNLDTSSMGKAFMPTTWAPSQGVSKFKRVTGPSLQASNSTTGSPAPYPSFKDYLSSLENETFTVSGAGNAGCSSSVTYDYSGTFESDNNGGYQVVLTSKSGHPMGGTPCGVPPAAITAQGTVEFDTATEKVTGVTITQPGSDYFTAAPTVTFSGGGATTQATGVAVLSSSGAVKSVTINDGGEGYTSAPTVTFTAPPAPPATVDLPSDLTVTVSLPKPGQNSGYDVNIYGAPATAFSVPEAGMSKKQVASLANSLYAVIAGDFLAGVNFGYVGDGSNAPQNSANWYSNPPTLYPFGDARNTNDGYYNPYAAVFYNMSDAYGFAYSDRGGRPSPYVPLPANATTMRITILNDGRLDTPLTSVSKTADTSLTIKWPEVTGATGYAVDVSYGGSVPVEGVTLSPSTPSPSGTKISGLKAGVTYEVRVTATGSNAKDNAIKSHTQSIFATTSGSMAAPSGDIKFNIGLNWSGNTSGKAPKNYVFTLNGNPYKVGAVANVQGSMGTNLYSLTITDKTTQSTVYQGNYVVEITEAPGADQAQATAAAFFLRAAAALLLRSLSLSLSSSFPLLPSRVGLFRLQAAHM